MPDYSQGKIYTIRCRNDDSLIYVGSTCQKLCKRFQNHKDDMVKGLNISLYQYVENWEDWYIELFEDYRCENREQLNRREGEIIRQIGTINKNIAGRTVQEYYIDNADKIKQELKQYRIDNADKIRQDKKRYYIDNADKIKKVNKQYYIDNTDTIKQVKKQYRIDNADRIKIWNKQYRIDNADRLKQQKNQYRTENAEKLKTIKQQKNICECGGKYTNSHKAKHYETQKHIKWELQKDKSNDNIDDYNRDKTPQIN